MCGIAPAGVLGTRHRRQPNIKVARYDAVAFIEIASGEKASSGYRVGRDSARITGRSM